MSDEPREWLLVKRNLYERPDHIGYTGVRDKAGRFTEEDAKSSVGDGGYGVTMVRLADAPEFTSACYDDIARDHLRSIIAAKDAELSRLHGREEEMRLRMFLEILSAMGGRSDASDTAWSWVNAFCEDHEGRDPDTYNRSEELGYTQTSHDTSYDSSTVYLTDAGRSFLDPTRQKGKAG